MTFRLTVWPFYALIGAIIVSFLFGGASREALNFHTAFNVTGWVGIIAIILFKKGNIFAHIPKAPLFIFLGLSLCIGISIIPLPSSWFSDSVIHQNILAERGLLNAPSSHLTLSLTPSETLRSFTAFGPPLFAMFVVSILGYRERQFIITLLMGLGVASIILGFTQLLTGADSSFYYWNITNRGFSVGIFANANHHSLFVASLIPLFALQLIKNTNKIMADNDNFGLLALYAALFALIILGILFGKSFITFSIAMIAILLSSLFISTPRKDTSKSWRPFFLGTILVIGLTVITGLMKHVGPNTHSIVSNNRFSRLDVHSKSVSIFQDYMTNGTGLGSFNKIYPFYENPENVNLIFVNHAQNDALQFAVELGLPGVALLVIFILWIIKSFYALVKNDAKYRGKHISRAAMVVVSIVLLQSLMDYPLRTPFLALIFAIMLTLAVTMPYYESYEHKDDTLTQRKHVVL